MMNDFDFLHEKALAVSSQLRASEKTLIELLMPIEKTKGHLDLGYGSLFAYCVGALKLSESQSYAFISIARASEKVPELNLAVQSNKISVSNARRVVSVLTPENKDLWLKKAAELPQKALEREVVRVNPALKIRERIRPISENLSEMRIGITPAIEAKLKRAKEVSANGTNQAALLEEVLSFYLKHKDPLEKAKRKQLCSNTVGKTVVLRAIPRRIQHEVNQRDQRRCQYRGKDGIRCGESCFVELHHLRPWAEGGGHEAQNLTTLCSRHHGRQHDEMRRYRFHRSRLSPV